MAEKATPVSGSESFSGADFYAGLEGPYVAEATGMRAVTEHDAPTEYTLVTPDKEHIKVTDKRANWATDEVRGELSRTALVHRARSNDSLSAGQPTIDGVTLENRERGERATEAEQDMLNNHFIRSMGKYVGGHPKFAEAFDIANDIIEKNQQDPRNTRTVGLVARAREGAEQATYDTSRSEIVVSTDIAEAMTLYLAIINRGVENVSADSLMQAADYFELLSAHDESAAINRAEFTDQLAGLNSFNSLPLEDKQNIMETARTAGIITWSEGSGWVGNSALGNSIVRHNQLGELRDNQLQAAEQIATTERLASEKQAAAELSRTEIAKAYHNISTARNRAELITGVQHFINSGDIEIDPSLEWPGISSSSTQGREVLEKIQNRDKEQVGFDETRVQKELQELKTLPEIAAYRAMLMRGRDADPQASQAQQTESIAIIQYLASAMGKEAISEYLDPQIDYRRNELVIVKDFKSLPTRSDVARVLRDEYEHGGSIGFDEHTGIMEARSNIGKIALEQARIREEIIDKKRAEEGIMPEYEPAIDKYWREQITAATTSEQIISIAAALSRAGLVEPTEGSKWSLPARDTVPNPDGSDRLSDALNRAANGVLGFNRMSVQRQLSEAAHFGGNMNPEDVLTRADELIASKSGADKVVFASMVEPLATIVAQHKLDQQFSNVKTHLKLDNIIMSEANAGHLRREGDQWLPVTPFGRLILQSYRQRQLTPFKDDALKQAASDALATERGAAIVAARREAAEQARNTPPTS